MHPSTPYAVSNLQHQCQECHLTLDLVLDNQRLELNFLVLYHKNPEGTTIAECVHFLKLGTENCTVGAVDAARGFDAPPAAKSGDVEERELDDVDEDADVGVDPVVVTAGRCC